jgi:hypothetical protein
MIFMNIYSIGLAIVWYLKGMMLLESLSGEYEVGG